MEIPKLLQTILTETKTAEQAHKLGLTYAGRGFWKDKSGKTVAQTKGDRLVRISGKQEPTKKPSAKLRKTPKITSKPQTTQASLQAPPEPPRASQGPSTQPHSSAERQLPKRPTKGTASGTAKDYNRAEFYQTSVHQPKHRAIFQQQIERSKDADELVLRLATWFGCDPNMNIIVNSQFCEDIAKRFGPDAEVRGAYTIGKNILHISKKTMEQFERFRTIPFHEWPERLDRRGEEDMKCIQSICTIVHEMIHAKDPNVASYRRALAARAIDPLDHTKYTFLNEGFVQQKAETIVWQLLTGKEKSPPVAKYYLGSYIDEVQTVRWVESKVPNSIFTAWQQTNIGQRAKVFEKEIAATFHITMAEVGFSFSQVETVMNRFQDFVTRSSNGFMRRPEEIVYVGIFPFIMGILTNSNMNVDQKMQLLDFLPNMTKIQREMLIRQLALRIDEP